MAIDEMLVGHWLHTDSMSSDQVSMVTDTHYILGQDGRFEYYTKTQDSFGGAGELQSGDHHDRSGDGRCHLHRAD